MSTDIKPGQVWAWDAAYDPREAQLAVLGVSDTYVEYRYVDLPEEPDKHDRLEWFTTRAHLVTDVDPTLDPLAPSADDALAASVRRLGKVWLEYRDQQVRGAAKALDVVAASVQQVVDAANAIHQPAPEPEPEWLFEFKGEEGPEGDEHWARRFPSRADALRSMIESASLDELNDFEGPVSFSVYTEETGPAESPLVVIDPASVDVDALAEALRREWSGKDFGVTFSWDAIARTLLAALGIEATS